MKAYRREKRKERKKRARGEEDGDEEDLGVVDPEMAAMMGFSGFGAKRKS